MNRTKDGIRRSGSLAVGWARVVIALLAGAFVLGCEHRMSLNEFLAMQQSVATAAAEEAKQAGPINAALINQKLGPYRIGAGDVLGVVVTPADQQVPVPPLQARVGTDGAIDLPMAGHIKVDGMTLSEAEAAIQNAYVPKYHRQASVFVQLAEAAPTDVLVVGAVVTPGLVGLRRTERNLLFAMARAGGASQLASGLVSLQRLREPGSQTTLNLRDPKGMEEALAAKPLESGDIVTVHAAEPNMVFVGGLVNVPAPQTYPPGTHVTVLQALTAAGGLREDLLPAEATLIRRVNGKDVHVKLDLDRLSKGKEENLALAPGDILWVPHTAGTRIHDFINRTVYLRVGATAGYSARYSDLGTRYYGDLKRRGTESIVIGP